MGVARSQSLSVGILTVYSKRLMFKMAEKIVGYRPDHNSDWYPIGGHGEPSSTEVGEMLLPFASLLEISKRSMQVKDDNGS